MTTNSLGGIIKFSNRRYESEMYLDGLVRVALKKADYESIRSTMKNFYIDRIYDQHIFIDDQVLKRKILDAIIKIVL